VGFQRLETNWFFFDIRVSFHFVKLNRVMPPRTMKAINFKPAFDLVCAEHGIQDSFPCPWPGCKNGIADDCFQLLIGIAKEKNDIYRRIQWQSPLEGAYYSWEKEDWPHWFSVRRTFWNEVRRLGLMPDEKLDVFYHYTSMEAFVGIIEADAIWLSDYSYLNDKTELIHGVNIVSSVISEFLSSGLTNIQKGLLDAWSEKALAPLPRVCVASFSGDGDSLSQWRAYGNVAIGFTPYKIGIHANQSQLGIVRYDPKIQKQLAQVYVSHCLQAYALDVENKALERIPDVYHRFGQVLELVSFFKDPSFRDEREYRLAYVEHPELFQDSIFGERPPKHFRVKGGRIYSHIVSSEMFPHTDRKSPLGICKVVLGPGADDLMELGIREFLDEKGLQDVTITRSQIPYRT
jgi:hypothetical protein